MNFSKLSLCFVMMAGAVLASCENEENSSQANETNFSTMSKLSEPEIEKITSSVTSNGISIDWNEGSIDYLKSMSAEEALPIIDIGRKSRNCFGIGICEWFPDPVGPQPTSLSKSQLVLPVLGIEENTEIIIKSRDSKEDFVIEEKLVIGNVTIPDGSFKFNENVGGYVIPVLVK